jgi:putative transposase
MKQSLRKHSPSFKARVAPEPCKARRPQRNWPTRPMVRGFLYLIAIIDWCSRHVLSWRLPNTLDGDFCIEAVEEALRKGRPDMLKTNQGAAQLTGEAFTRMLEQHGVRTSMDGKGRYGDNLFVQRLWRTVKYEEVYLKVYQDGRKARIGIGDYFCFYDTERPHQALGYRTPAEAYASIPVEAREGGVVESPPDTLRTAGPALNMASSLS